MAAERAFDIVAFTAPLNNWGDAVKLGIVPQARHAASEFAGTKYLSWSENLTRYERAHEQGFDEVVLLNERGEVAECTSANIFMVQGENVFTPPLSSGCLPGVTRALYAFAGGNSRSWSDDFGENPPARGPGIRRRGHDYVDHPRFDAGFFRSRG